MHINLADKGRWSCGILQTNYTLDVEAEAITDEMVEDSKSFDLIVYRK